VRTTTRRGAPEDSAPKAGGTRPSSSVAATSSQPTHLRRARTVPDSVTLLIHASQGDMGRIIGKRGRVIQALRQLGRAAGSTEGVRITVDVAE
jgi:predicted RNA-binding protein YlqC (UPF0109 family)